MRNRPSDRLDALMLIGLPDPELSDRTKRLLDAIRPGFIVLFSRNAIGAEELGRLVADVSLFLGYKPLFAVDQEGGRVTRLVKGFTVIPDARTIAASGDIPAARQCGEIVGREMASIGLRWNFAPVADVLSNRNNPGVGLRSFGEEPDAVVAYADAFLRGLRSAGVEGCLKHFPGLGRASIDPHHTLAAIPSTRAELLRTELAPFVGIKASAWMPTHVSVPAVDPSGTPATLSRPVLTLAREVGFDGVLVADDLMMGGITSEYLLEDALARSLAAGMDILTLCHRPEEQIRLVGALRKVVDTDERLQERVRESEERVTRFYRSIEELADESTVEPARGREDDRVRVRAIAEAAIDDRRIPGDRLRKPTIVLAPRERGYSPAAEPSDGVPRVAALLAKRYDARLHAYTGDTKIDLPPESEGPVLLITENAHLNEALRSWIEQTLTSLKSRKADVDVLVIGTPYDTAIPGCEHAICSYGSYLPQTEAILSLFAREVE